MTCQKQKSLINQAVQGFSLQLNNNALDSLQGVGYIKGHSDELFDFMIGSNANKYNTMKKEITSPKLIDQSSFEELKKKGLIPKDVSSPTAELSRKIKKLDRELFSKENLNLQGERMKDLYRDADQTISHLFETQADFTSYMQNRFEMYRTLDEYGINVPDFYNINGGSKIDFAKDLTVTLESTGRYGIYKYLQGEPVRTLDDMATILKDRLWKEVHPKLQTPAKMKEIERFVDDIIYNPKPSSAAAQVTNKVFQATRNIAIPLSYTAGVMSGAKLFVTSATVGSIDIIARSGGVAEIKNHPLFNIFSEEYNILKSETRLNHDLEFGKGWIDNIFALGANVTENEKARKALIGTGKVLQGGFHTTWDFMAENAVKKLALSEAMADNGINALNMDVYLKMHQDGTLPQSLVNRIRVDAHNKYTSYFTNSQSKARTGHRLDRGWMKPFNFMQGYATHKTGQIISGFSKASDAIKTGEINPLKPNTFLRWLNTSDGAELRNFLLNTIVSAKMASYLEMMVSANGISSHDDAEERIKNYTLGLSDYITAAESSIIVRMLDSIYEGATTEYVYEDSNGVTHTERAGISGSAYLAIQELMRSTFREFKVAKLVPALAKDMLETGEPDFGHMLHRTDTVFNSLTNGIGRFALSPNNNPYGLVAYAENSDTAGDWLMIKDKTNASLAISQKMRTVGDISKFMDQPLKTLADTVGGNVLWQTMDLAIRGKYNEGSYTALQHFIETDTAMNDLYNGRFNSSVLLTNEDVERVKKETGKEYKSNIDGFFSELTSFQYVKGETESSIQLGSDYGLNDTNYEAIVQNLKNTIGEDIYDMYMADMGSFNGNGWTKDMQEATIMAVLEKELPGGPRMMLAIKAKDDYDKEVAKILGKKGSDSDLSEQERQNLKKSMLEKYGDRLIAFDNYARFNLVQTRAEQIDPDMMPVSNDLSRVANATAFMQMIVHDQSRQGNLDSRYLASTLSLTGKYLPDGIRLPVIKQVFREVDSMKIPEGDKSILKTGISLGNIDYISTIAKDPEMKDKYKDILDDTLSLIYNTNKSNQYLPSLNSLKIDEDDYSGKRYPKGYKRSGRGYGRGNRGYSKNYGKFSSDYDNLYGEKATTPHVQENYNQKKKLAEKIATLPDFVPSNKIRASSLGSTRPKNNYAKILDQARFNLEIEEKKQQVIKSKTLATNPNTDTISPVKLGKGKQSYHAKKWKVVENKLPKTPKKYYKKLKV